MTSDRVTTVSVPPFLSEPVKDTLVLLFLQLLDHTLRGAVTQTNEDKFLTDNQLILPHPSPRSALLQRTPWIFRLIALAQVKVIRQTEKTGFEEKDFPQSNLIITG